VRAHLAKACASSKKTSGFSKVRTSRKWCPPSNKVRTFDRAAAGPALHRVPFSRKVVTPLASASVAWFGDESGEFLVGCLRSCELDLTWLQAQGMLSRLGSTPVGPAIKKAVPGWARLRVLRDLQLIAVP
jgi:hypothetical protein